MTFYLVGFIITFTTVFFMDPHWARMSLTDKFVNALLIILFSVFWPLCMYKCAYSHLDSIRKRMA